MRKLRIGLALGGGGARGLSHIGVLKVFEQENIKIDAIAGTSMGSIIAAMYASGFKPEEIEKKAKDFIFSNRFTDIKLDFLKDRIERGPRFVEKLVSYIKQRFIFSVSQIKTSLIKEKKVDEIINFFLPDKNIEELKIKFSTVSCDLISGKKVVFNRGSLQKAVKASMSIPGVFPPVKYKNMLLVDGGAVELLPGSTLKTSGIDFVIGIDVKSRMRKVKEDEFSNGIEIIFRANYITSAMLNEVQLNNVDFLLSPSVKNIHWAHLEKIDYCIIAGENAVKKSINKLKKEIKKRWLITLPKRLF